MMRSFFPSQARCICSSASWRSDWAAFARRARSQQQQTQGRADVCRGFLEYQQNRLAPKGVKGGVLCPSLVHLDALSLKEGQQNSQVSPEPEMPQRPLLLTLLSCILCQYVLYIISVYSVYYMYVYIYRYMYILCTVLVQIVQCILLEPRQGRSRSMCRAWTSSQVRLELWSFSCRKSAAQLIAQWV